MQKTHVNPDNIAIECTLWTLTREEAKKLNVWFKENNPISPGGYWQTAFKRPYNLMIRHKKQEMKVRTAGFTTGEFSNYLFSAGIQES